MRTHRYRSGALGAAAALVVAYAARGPAARASDHTDTASTADAPAADIADVFAWMSPDGGRVNLAMTVHPTASITSRFDPAVQYAFHLGSSPAFGGPAASSVDVICHFDAAQRVACWVGTEAYVTGDASATSGLASADGRVRVFAGLRGDPAFWNREGFEHFARVGRSLRASNPASDPFGCPMLDSASSDFLTRALGTNATGAAPVDAFATTSVLALVLQLDRAMVTAGGPVLSVWASTHRSVTP